MLKLLYDSRTDDGVEVSRAIEAMPVPEGMSIVLLSRMWGDPDKAAGTDYAGAVYETSTCMEHLPGIWPHELVHRATYSRRQPCEAVTLYHDGLDLCAETEHPYGNRHTVIRFMRKKDYDELWGHLGKTSRKAWHKIMRRTLPAHEAMPELMSLARPCRLVPVGPDGGAGPAADGKSGKCPVCGGNIDLDGVDVNNNTEDGYGEMAVYHACPHCGAELYVIYDAQDGYDFKRIEKA